MQIQYSPFFSDSYHRTQMHISNSGWVQTDETWKQKPLPVPYSRIYFVQGGSGCLLTDKAQICLEPGFAYLAPSGAPCGFYGTDSVTKLFFHVQVTTANGYDLFSAVQEPVKIPFDVERTEKLKAWFFSDDTVKQTLLKCALWETVAAFAEELRLTETGQNNCSAVVVKAMGYIRKNLSAGLTVTDVCNAVFCSVGVLTKAFRQEVGVTMARYIEDLVMQEAQWQLLQTDKTVGQVSAELGFCDQFYFTRRFTKRFRITPREYRKNRPIYEL